MLRMREPEPAFNTTRRRAAKVFWESATCGFALGCGTAFLVAFVLVAKNESAGPAGIVYPFLAGALGGQVGMTVGLIAGAAGALYVRMVEPGCGAHVVAWFLPVIGLVVSLAIAAVFALPGTGAWRVLVFGIATVLSLIGSAIVASRYRRRAEWASVH
jgi:hypothetical protein